MATNKSASNSEEYVLGYAIRDTKHFGETVSYGVSVTSFESDANRTIFDSAMRIFEDGREVSCDAIIADLGDRKLVFDIGGPDRISSLEAAGRTLTDRSVNTHVSSVLAAETIRGTQDRLIRALAELRDSSLSPKEKKLRLDDLIRHLTQAAGTSSDTYRTEAWTESVLHLTTSAAAGTLVTHQHLGIPAFDRRFGGLANSQLHVLAARPSHGKTALAGEIALRVARQHSNSSEHPGQVLFFSAEMPARQVATRLAGNIAGIDYERIRDGGLTADELAKLRRYMDRTKEELNIIIDDNGQPTTTYILSKAFTENARKPVRLIIFDHLEHTGDKDPAGKSLSLEKALMGCFMVAKKIGCPVLILQQLNREIEGRTSLKPMLSDLRYTGFSEQIAYTVSFPYWPFTHWLQREGAGFDGQPEQHQYAWYVKKNRGGRLGKVDMLFYPEMMRFVDPEEDSMIDEPTDTPF